MARLYPENQPKVFNRLWEEVVKRKQKQEKMKRLSEKQSNEQWMIKLKEAKKEVWERMLANRSDLRYDNLHVFSQSQTYKSSLADKKHLINISNKSIIKFPSTHKITPNRHASSNRLDTSQSDSSGLVVKTANMSMLNPNKIRESSFITDLIRCQQEQDANEVPPKPNNFNISTQTDIKGRMYDELDDEVLDEIIEMNMQNLSSVFENSKSEFT